MAKAKKKVWILDGGSLVGHLHVPPAFQRCEQHEEVGRSVALVLIMPCGMSRLRREESLTSVQ